MDNNVFNFLKKYRVYLLVGILIISQLNSCGKSTQLRAMDKQINELKNELESVDSLVNQVKLEGIIIGRDLEKDKIYNFILTNTKQPLDLRTRELIVDITDAINKNEHRK